ncbi:MAG: type II toxin-antitoxin system PemK/MazF family toxin [archaeon]
MQKSSSSFEQGDVVTADIVYSQQFGFKRRPVLVISNTNYNKTSADLIVISISSTQPKSKYDLKLGNSDLAEGELRAESKIIVDFPTTIEKTLIPQKIGKISAQKLREVKQKIKELYEL